MEAKQSGSRMSRRCAMMLLALLLCVLPYVPMGAEAKNLAAVTVAIHNELSTLDPHKIRGAFDQAFFSNVFEGLYGRDASGKPVPLLATGHTVAPDGLTYDFTLRQNVFFHNGDPMTAQDVRFSWVRAGDPAIGNPRAAVLVGNIADVEIVNPHRVRVKLKQKDAALIANLSEYWYIVPKEHIERVGNKGFEAAPVGTGPFKFAKYTIRESFDLEGFTKYWGARPAVDKLRLRFITDDQTRMASLQTGESDIVTNVPAFMVPVLQRTGKIDIIQSPSLRNVFLAFNTHPRSRLADRRVREAINLAIDRKALAKSVMQGLVEVQTVVCYRAVLGCDIPRDAYPFDPANARRLLREANFDTAKPLRIVAPIGLVPQAKETLEGVLHFLHQVGFKTEVTRLELGAFRGAYGGKDKEKSDTEIFLTTFSDYHPDPSGRLLRMLKTNEGFSWFNDPALDAMLDQMNEFTDPRLREDHLRKIFLKTYDDHALGPLWTINNIYGVRKHIGWKPEPYVDWPVFQTLGPAN